MVRGFKYRFYPTPDQKRILARTFGSVRYVYNRALDLRSTAWRERNELISYNASSSALTEWKRSPETVWLNEVSSVPTQQSLRHLQTAFVNFWKHGAKYPTFKSRHGHQSAEFTRSGFQWDGETLTLAKIGALDIRWSREFTAQPSTVTVSRTPAGRYEVSIRVDEPLAVMPKAVGQIGIDLGLTTFATISTGVKFDAPRPLRTKMERLKAAQKRLSRRVKGSRNRAKARLQVARMHQKIGDTRKDFLHKTSTKLVRENQAIAVEDLNVSGMVANHTLAGAISDSSWSEFVRQLEYKCEWYGRAFVKIGRFVPSSKRCSQCGNTVEAMPLDIREWSCGVCGAHHDRDVNAAVNIRDEAFRGGTRPISLPSEPCGNAAGNRNRLVNCA